MLHKIKASKARISADRIEKLTKVRQTGEHHAYEFVASKNVSLRRFMWPAVFLT